MTTTNHWGKWVDSDSPITGVISNNEISQFISDESYNAIDLDYEAFIAELATQYDEDSDEYQEAIEYYESDSPTLLIGDWIQGEDGKYEPDTSEGKEYAAIVREDVTQVVWSIYTIRARLCAPTYPGQADVEKESNGEYLAYTLPPAAFEVY